jgi:hypothetical protein
LEAIEKAKKGLSLMRFLTKHVNRKVLDLTFKMHVRPHLEYGDVIFHNCSKDLMDQIESVQYQAGLIVTGCWQGTSRLRLYKELGWESMAERRNFRRLTLYHKIKSNSAPDYLKSYVLDSAPCGTARYKRTFFPDCFVQWEGLEPSLKQAPTTSLFKSQFLKNIRPPKKYFQYSR